MIPHTTTSLVLAKVLVDRPELAAILSFEDVVRYVDLIHCLKPLIAMQEASYHHDPPDTFSVQFHEFLKICLDISDGTAKLAWFTLHTLAWECHATEGEEEGLQHRYMHQALHGAWSFERHQ